MVSAGDCLTGATRREGDFRIVYISPESDPERVAYLSAIPSRSLPVVSRWSDIEQLIASGKLSVVTASNIPYRPDADISPRTLLLRDAAWQRLGDFTQCDKWTAFLLASGSQRALMISEIAKKATVTEIRIRFDINRFFQGGMTLSGMTPRFCNPNRGKRQIDGRKRGRKSARGVTGIVVLESLRVRIEQIVLKSEKRGDSVDDQYHEILTKLFSTRSLDDRGREIRVLKSESERLSRSQHANIRHELHLRNLLIKAKAGPRVYISQIKGGVKSWNGNVAGPGSVYLLDMSGSQVELVSQSRRTKLVGTANFGIVIDVFSRRIVGFCLTLESAKWETAATAVYYSIASKKPLFKRYGIVDDAAENPAEGKPRLLGIDRGPENTGDESDRMIALTGIHTFNTRAWHGSDKPHVERAIQTFKTLLFRRVRGWRRKGGKARGAIDPKKNAVLTLYEVTRLFLDTALKFNRSVLPLEAIPYRARLANIKPTPNELWRFGINHLTGGLIKMAPDELKTKLLGTERAKITKTGVMFRKQRFTCDDFEGLDLYSKARKNGSAPIDVKVDPCRPDEIWYWNSKSRKMIRLARQTSEIAFERYFPQDFNADEQLHDQQRAEIEAENTERNFTDYNTRKRIEANAQAEQRAQHSGHRPIESNQSIRSNRNEERLRQAAMDSKKPTAARKLNRTPAALDSANRDHHSSLRSSRLKLISQLTGARR